MTKEEFIKKWGPWERMHSFEKDLDSLLEAAEQAALADRFKKPTDDELIDMAILFSGTLNCGKIDQKQITSMSAICSLVIDRLYENGQIHTPTKDEGEVSHE